MRLASQMWVAYLILICVPSYRRSPMQYFGVLRCPLCKYSKKRFKLSHYETNHATDRRTAYIISWFWNCNKARRLEKKHPTKDPSRLPLAHRTLAFGLQMEHVRQAQVGELRYLRIRKNDT